MENLDELTVIGKIKDYSIKYARIGKDGNYELNMVYTNIDDTVVQPGERTARMCTTYALQTVLGMSFEDTYMLQAEYGVKRRALMNYIPVVMDILKDRGFTLSDNYKPNFNMKDVEASVYKDESVRDFIMSHKTGKCLFIAANRNREKANLSHALAMINGELYEHMFTSAHIQTDEYLRNNWEHTMVKRLSRMLKDYYIIVYAYKED